MMYGTDVGFKIRSEVEHNTQATHNTESLRISGEETFVYLKVICQIELRIAAEKYLAF